MIRSILAALAFALLSAGALTGNMLFVLGGVLIAVGVLTSHVSARGSNGDGSGPRLLEAVFDDVKAGHTVRMRGPRGVVDSSLSVLLEGYAWLPARRARSASGVAHTRVLGQRAVGLCGPDAARFFYDEDHVRRHIAIPWPVQNTLFGRHAVHTLDGAAHRCRKDVSSRP